MRWLWSALCAQDGTCEQLSGISSRSKSNDISINFPSKFKTFQDISRSLKDLSYIILYYITLYYITLYYIILYYVILYYIILYYFIYYNHIQTFKDFEGFSKVFSFLKLLRRQHPVDVGRIDDALALSRASGWLQASG